MGLRAKKFRLYAGGLLVALTCPCHTPFYIFLLSGTSLGAILAENELIFLSALGIAFPIFVFIVLISYQQIKKLPHKTAGDSCNICNRGLKQ